MQTTRRSFLGILGAATAALSCGRLVGRKAAALPPRMPVPVKTFDERGHEVPELEQSALIEHVERGLELRRVADAYPVCPGDVLVEMPDGSLATPRRGYLDRPIFVVAYVSARDSRDIAVQRLGLCEVAAQ